MTLSEALTARELKHARLVWQGYSNWEISRLLKRSQKYLENRLGLIYRKLGIVRNDGGSNFDPRIRLAVLYEKEFGNPVRPASSISDSSDKETQC